MNDPTPVAQCHCSHVVVVMHDMKRAEKAMWLLFGLGLAFGVKELTAIETDHIRANEPIGRQGERLAPDRVPEPQQ